MKTPKASRPSTLSRNRLKFIRLAEKRINKAAKQLQLIGNLSNKTNYAYSDEEVEKMFDYVDSCLQSARERFKSTDTGPKTMFTLED